ncbi:hypothetical protein BU24DRAFT_465839 [Aaosphaeria arxii CBS 175.79]|uniref:Uncharacterized protein n=1 Tax=Aaosphaeria arxii CBS 175.79 TaxID=1450172 RepID=A0A6A5XH64_9PLEO|nr:uncharacterized protein BU24DRAFT_465839 [Aaosphaeria arxii CBS 175.79]KAF2012283.1 hypothetical protein BU24DRAFT_465839 [Aaosphaeria arxii CBS 175.79]
MSTTPAQPSAKQRFETLAKSQIYWRKVLKSAKSELNLPSSCFHVHALLNKTPSIPCVQSVPDIADYTLELEGFAEWNISSQSGCSLDSSTKQSRSQKAVIGIDEPNFCKLGAAPATNELDPCFPANFLAILSLGWSYIFSSKLCELRGKTAADRVSYTDTKAAVRERASMATKNSLPVYMPDGIS